MSRGKRGDLSIRIDVRYNQIFFHQTTLKEIGDPKFIWIGIQRSTKDLIIFAEGIDRCRAIRVWYSPSGSFTLRSKPLIKCIQLGTHCLEKPGSYLLKGKKISSIPAISYSLKDAYLDSADGNDRGNNHEETEY